MTSTNHDKTVVIDRDYHWRVIDDETPRGKKLQLINQHAGVACYGKLGTDVEFWTHWAPLPTFAKGK